MTSPLEQCRDALSNFIEGCSTGIDAGAVGRAAIAAAEAALAAQPEPVAWAQLGMRNGHTYVRMNYEGHLYPPPPDVQRNLNLVPLYAAPAAAPVAQGWVSMDERLPPEGVRVLVYVPTCDLLPIQADEWSEQCEDPLGMGGPTISTGYMWDEHEFEEVTHWMPLPAPPKEPA